MKYASQIRGETIAASRRWPPKILCASASRIRAPASIPRGRMRNSGATNAGGHALEQPMPDLTSRVFPAAGSAVPAACRLPRERRITVSHGSDCMAVDCICDAYTPHLFRFHHADFYLTTDLPTANLESTVYPAAPFGRNQPKVLPARPGQTAIRA